MQLFIAPLALALLAPLSGCMTAGTEPEIPGCRGMECVALGEAQELGPQPGDLIVTPRAVIEDSRCPIEADCVWAGRLRLKADVQLGHEVITVELATDEPLRINGGMLSIAEVAPDASVEWTPIPPEAYRFGFAFGPDIMETPAS